MKKSIIILSFLMGINSFAQPSNVASITDVKESVHYLIVDYKDVKNRLEQDEARIKILEEALNKKYDDKNSSQKVKKTSSSNTNEDQIIIDYLNQNKNN